MSFANLFAQGKFIEIISPEDNKLQTELTMNVVVSIKKQSADYIKIITPVEQIIMDINSSKALQCKNISLKLGENTVIVRTYKNKALVEEKRRHIYVSSELYHQFKYPPIKYKQSYFHNDANEKLCATCHDMSVNETKGVAFKDVTKSNCYQCHKNVTKGKFAHAPAVNWLCTSCHKTKNRDKRKYITPKVVNESCFECHKDNKKLWSSAKYKHEPLDAGNCSKCHNSHASPYSMFLRKPVNEICVGCHADKHIQARESKNSKCGYNDTKLCTSCHTPHASNKPFFVKNASEKKEKK
ncbi:MAG: cytochrome c3 family protein [Sulfurimonas sp.]|nr:cytochrome c3 family protein [Sulfurimonas sp.]